MHAGAMEVAATRCRQAQRLNAPAIVLAHEVVLVLTPQFAFDAVTLVAMSSVQIAVAARAGLTVEVDLDIRDMMAGGGEAFG